MRAADLLRVEKRAQQRIYTINPHGVDENEIPNNDPKLDLVLHRNIDVPKEKVWRAFTEPELIKQWFYPKPWQTVECRVDLRPGAEFYTKMQGPNQESHAGASCFLEIVPQEKLVWTCSLLLGYRPTPVPIADSGSCDSILFNCVITLVDTAGGTKYTAHVMHYCNQYQQTKAQKPTRS